MKNAVEQERSSAQQSQRVEIREPREVVVYIPPCTGAAVLCVMTYINISSVPF